MIKYLSLLNLFLQNLFLQNLFLVNGFCPSDLNYIEPPICTKNTIGSLGLKKTYQYAKVLFGTIDNHVTKDQRNCILDGPLKISDNIKKCSRDITINNHTNPEKVAQGLALNNNNQWVSACAEDMPCVEFNNFVGNSSFTKLIEYCGATQNFKDLFNNTHFIKSSWYGYEYCQNLYPKKCLYLEKELCSNHEYLYACPVSRWIYASNFMLLYILDPLIASKMPNCRIIK